jgi:hypothetical protein
MHWLFSHQRTESKWPVHTEQVSSEFWISEDISKKKFRGCLDPKWFILCRAVNGPQEREYVVRIIISQGASNTRKEREGARTIISINEWAGQQYLETAATVGKGRGRKCDRSGNTPVAPAWLGHQNLQTQSEIFKALAIERERERSF